MRRVVLLALGVLGAFAGEVHAAPDLSNWRPLDPEQTLYIDTTQGRIVVELAPEVAPGHVDRIKQLTREGFYDGLLFHRVINGFMAQTGDPQGTGQGGSDQPDLAGEFEFRRGPSKPYIPLAGSDGSKGFVRTLPIASQPDAMMQLTRDRSAAAWALHCPGVASMARANDPNSANSQFFLMRGISKGLDRKYTAWGRVVWNQSAVQKLAIGEPPPRPDSMVTVRIAADLPESERAPLYVMRTDGALFVEQTATQSKARAEPLDLCDIEFTAHVPAEATVEGTSWWRQIPQIP